MIRGAVDVFKHNKKKKIKTYHSEKKNQNQNKNHTDNSKTIKVFIIISELLFIQMSRFFQAMRKRHITENVSIPVPTLKEIMSDVKFNLRIELNKLCFDFVKNKKAHCCVISSWSNSLSSSYESSYFDSLIVWCFTPYQQYFSNKIL